MNAYFLSHNGLGDNVTSIGALNFISQFYNTVYFLCKDIYIDNVKLFFVNKNIILIPIDFHNETNDCRQIINSVSSNDDIFICGGIHKSYLKSRINNPKILAYVPNDSYTLDNYLFIKDFYVDVGLDLSIYCQYFNIPSSDISLKIYSDIKHLNIIFTHTQASNKKININDIVHKYINNQAFIIICANENLYKPEDTYYTLCQQFVNIPIAHYIDVIINASEIYVIDSCFSAMILPLKMSKRLKATNIEIIDRNV